MSWVGVAGRGISKNDKANNNNKKRIFVGMKVRDDVTMKLDKRSQFKG